MCAIMHSNGHRLFQLLKCTALPVISNPVYVGRISMYRPSSQIFTYEIILGHVIF